METVSWHTVIYKSHLYGDFIHIADEDGNRVGCTDASDPEQRANAEIMAAGPHLVALAQKVAATQSCGYCRHGRASMGTSACCLARVALARLRAGEPTDPRLTADGVLADLGAKS